jgi:hypothetical protein
MHSSWHPGKPQKRKKWECFFSPNSLCFKLSTYWQLRVVFSHQIQKNCLDTFLETLVWYGEHIGNLGNMLTGTQWGPNWEQQKPNIHALPQKKMYLGPLGGWCLTLLASSFSWLFSILCHFCCPRLMVGAWTMGCVIIPW